MLWTQKFVSEIFVISSDSEKVLWYTDYRNEVARMNLIETKPVGDANFYKFSVDFTGDDFILGGKTLPLGIITHDILNIPADKLLYVFKTGDKLNDYLIVHYLDTIVLFWLIICKAEFDPILSPKKRQQI